MSWVADQTPEDRQFKCTAKFRYRQPDQGVAVEVIDDTHIKVVFDQPQRAVTPGQEVVLYQGDVCLGGGTIDTIEKMDGRVQTH
jgi:tRNA-specific 2-thiouridylase